MADSNIPGSSLSSGSEPVFDVVCQPCSEDKNVEAEGYCEDCCEHLCSPCITSHKRFTISKHHKIVGKDKMPRTQDTSAVRDACTQRCRLHKDEIVKYFCPDHKVLGCSVCVTLKHNKCGVSYIPDVASGLEDSQDYSDFKTNIADLVQKAKDKATFAQDSMKRSSECVSTAIQDIDAYREEMVDAINRRANDMKEEARKINAENMDKMKTLTTHSNQNLIELQSALSDVDTLVNQGHLCQAFIEMKKKGQNLKKLQETNVDLCYTEVTDYTFQPGEELRRVVTRANGFGKMAKECSMKGKPQTAVKGTSQIERQSVSVMAAKDVHEVKATHVADINVQSSDEREPCTYYIRCCTDSQR